MKWFVLPGYLNRTTESQGTRPIHLVYITNIFCRILFARLKSYWKIPCNLLKVYEECAEWNSCAYLIRYHVLTYLINKFSFIRNTSWKIWAGFRKTSINGSNLRQWILFRIHLKNSILDLRWLNAAHNKCYSLETIVIFWEIFSIFIRLQYFSLTTQNAV